MLVYWPTMYQFSASRHGVDINVEALFVSPVQQDQLASVSPVLRWLLMPRPDLGGDINTSGATSQLYLGLVWTAILLQGVLEPNDSLFLDLGFGPAFNNGSISTTAPNRASLGSHTLFHGSLAVGYRINQRYSVFQCTSSTVQTARWRKKTMVSTTLASRSGSHSDVSCRPTVSRRASANSPMRSSARYWQRRGATGRGDRPRP